MSVYCVVLCSIVLLPVYFVLLCCASLSTNKDNNNMCPIKKGTLKKVSVQFRLGGGSFNRKASPANRVFVELFCSINSHKYIRAVRPIKALKMKNFIVYTILSSNLTNVDQ